MNRSENACWWCSNRIIWRFGHHTDPARGHRRRGRESNRLAGQRPFPEEVSGTHDADDRLLAGLGNDRQLDAALLNVEDALARLTLDEDRRGCWIVDGLSRDARGIEERLGVESTSRFRGHPGVITLSDKAAGPFSEKPVRRVTTTGVHKRTDGCVDGRYDPRMLFEFIDVHRDDIIARCREKVARRVASAADAGGNRSRRACVPASAEQRAPTWPELRSGDRRDGPSTRA